MDKKLVIVMVGLPARGKSTMARKITGTLRRDEVNVQIFNNGDVRRKLSTEDTSTPEVFSPENTEGVKFRDKCARINLDLAHDFLKN